MSERKDIHDWFRDDSECISAEQAEAYRTGKLEGAEKNALERHLLTCELCAEAWEGIEAAQAEGVLTAAVTDITDRAWKRAEERERKKRRGAWIWMSSAAGIALLVVAGFLLLRSGDEKRMEEAFGEQFDRYPAEEKANGGDQQLGRGLEDSDRLAMDHPNDQPTEDLKMVDSRPSLREEAPPPPMMADLEAVADADMIESEEMADISVFDRTDDEVMPKQPAKEVQKDVKALETTTVVTSNDKMVAEKEKSEQKNRELQLQLSQNGVATGDNKERAIFNGADATTKSVPANGNTSSPAVVITPQSTSSRQFYNSNENLSGSTTTYEGINERKKSNKQDNFKGTASRAKTTASAPKRDNAGAYVVTDSMAFNQVAASEEDDFSHDMNVNVGGAKPVAPNNYQLGRTAYDQGNYPAAFGYFEKAAQENPNNMDAQFYAGLTRLIQEKPAEAMPYFNRILSSGVATVKQKEDAEWYKALTFLKLKEKAKAEALLKGIEAKKGVYAPKATETLKTLD